MANDLLIKINADAKNATKAFEDVKKQTEDLEDTLTKVAVVSGVAFAAFTAEIFLSVKAFEEARQSSVQLTNALQNQGIYTVKLKEQYDQFAKTVQAKTGIDDDAISKAQAVAQGFLGQTKATEALTFAIADLGTYMGGDLNGAAEKIARTIGTGTNAFARQGLVIREGATEAERYAKVLEFVQLKAGGLGEQMNKADGYAKALTTSFGNFQEQIGARFAPIIEAGRKLLIGFFDAFTNHPELANFAAALLAAGVVVAGLTAALAAGVPIFLALSAAAATFGVALNLAFAGIPLLIAGIIIAITELALHWGSVMAFLKSAAAQSITFVTELFGGLGKVIAGVFNGFDTKKMAAGLEQIKDSGKKAEASYHATHDAITADQQAALEKQDAQKKKAADKEAALERAHQANLRGIRKAEIELLTLQNEHASAELIALKTREIEVLKALDANKSNEENKLLQQRREEIIALEDQQRAEDIARMVEFAQLQADTKAELDALGITTEAQIRADRLTQIQATAQTEQDVDRALQEKLLQQKITARNLELADRKKYGVAAATINKFLNSDEVQGTKQASDELVALQQSKNSTLKGIGKAAAVAQITISTAQAAMNIFTGFSTIPIVGPALGVIGAAAAVAFGAERIGQVTAAAEGGLLEGGIPGRDSIPVLAQHGELVTPRKNFDEVVGAVRTQREGGADNSEMVNLLKSIDGKFSAPQQTIIQGDVLSDDTWVDALCRKISDAVEFRNVRIKGVA